LARWRSEPRPGRADPIAIDMTTSTHIASMSVMPRWNAEEETGVFDMWASVCAW
jgi:hypothetical protein